MAVRNATPSDARTRTWLVAASLVVLFLVALFLRAYWNVDAARTDDGTFVLSGGSDPYYHKRAVDWILADHDGDGRPDFKSLYNDPMLNYPYGSVNPNPPLYQWSVALAGYFLAPLIAGGDVVESTWWAMEWSPAVYGALTLIPIYFIGAALFDRRVGLVAALFWTLSTSAIDTGGLGGADHDAAIMFFASLAFLFYIKTIQQFRGDGNWVASWRSGAAISSGYGRFFRERQLGLGYALLTAVSIGAVALVWKGFPYVIGILFAYAGLQMVLDHWKNRDSLGLFWGTFIAIGVGTLVAYPYYANAEVSNFLRPVWFLVGGFFIAGLVLVPTRDLPTILVFPLALAAAAVGALVAFFVFPDVAQGLLYATVYFKQTALYETIAEAHPADFSSIVFGIGVVPFFLALFAWFGLLFSIRRQQTRPILFALVWAGIALFMANSAIRFLFNAIPIFAVLGAFGLVWVIDWVDFTTIRKSVAANRGSFWTGFRKGVRPLQIVTVVLAVLLLVLPNALLAADAALPPEDEQRIRESTESEFVKNFVAKRMGAYGQGFLPGYWLDGLEWLDEHDRNITDEAARPAFLSWWDYGHWAIAVGRHPAVADNFQNGYLFAANFILSENETHAVQLMGARLVDLPNANAEAALRDAGATDPAASLATLKRFQHDPDLDLEESVALLAKLEQNTGKRIRYFAADVRMLPYDDPQTSSVEQSSIYYAPVKLAERDPDDYLQVKINFGGSYITVEEYKTLASDPTRQIQASGERMEFTQKFFNSMFWRAYVGAPVQAPTPVTGDQLIQGLNSPAPGYSLQHFRLVYANDGVKILEYTPGARLTGTVTEEGSPVEGAQVVVYDDAGALVVQSFNAEFRSQVNASDYDVAHSFTTTDANGGYSLLAPFALEGGSITVVATKDGVELARQRVSITREEASQGKDVQLDLALKLGAVEGTVFEDKDVNGAFDAANDTALGNMTITVGGRDAVTDAEGKFSVTGVPAGRQNVTLADTNYTVAASASKVTVNPGQTATHAVPVTLKPATVQGTAFADLDPANGVKDEGEALPAQSVILFTADPSVVGNTAETRNATTDGAGNYTATLKAGSYIVSATYSTSDGATYKVESPLVLVVGESKKLDLALVKS